MLPVVIRRICQPNTVGASPAGVNSTVTSANTATAIISTEITLINVRISFFIFNYCSSFLQLFLLVIFPVSSFL